MKKSESETVDKLMPLSSQITGHTVEAGLYPNYLDARSMLLPPLQITESDSELECDSPLCFEAPLFIIETPTEAHKELPGGPEEAACDSKLNGIVEHPSYHGTMRTKEAEIKLRQHGGDCYLTRFSKSKNVYVLTVFKSEEELCQNFQIDFKVKNDYNMYEILGTQKEFDDFFVLLDFYKSFPLSHNISTIGEILTTQ